MISVLLADDQEMVLAGFRMILETEDDIDVVGEARDGNVAVELARTLQPDVVVMDIRMPHLDGIEATRAVTAMPEPPSVVVVTTFDDDSLLFNALRAGAVGLLLKNAPPEQLVEAVRIAAAGEGMLSTAITRRVLAEFARTAETEKRDDRIEVLTARERDVLRLVGRGLSNDEIATRLFISPATAKTHVARLMSKLQTRSRAEAVVLAYESGLVKPGLADDPVG